MNIYCGAVDTDPFLVGYVVQDLETKLGNISTALTVLLFLGSFVCGANVC